MDTSETVTHVSLCAGYGGIDLGLKRAIPALRTIAFSEIEAFACANLVAKMEAGQLDPAPIWTDLKTFPWDSFRGKVDILSGGYPCQPFSAAGKRLGESDPRHLWPYIADGIARMRPRICFFENVEGHITLGLRNVLQDLAGMGYRATWGIFSASEVGAPHQRKRVFILAYRVGTGLERFRWDVSDWGESRRVGKEPGGPTSQGGVWRRVSFAADCIGGDDDELGDECSICGESYSECGCPGPTQDGYEYREFDGVLYARPDHAWPSRPGEQQHGWEPPRVVHSTRGDDFIKALGWDVADCKCLRESQPEGGKFDERGRAGDGGEAMGNSELPRLEGRAIGCNGGAKIAPEGCCRQTQPPLGRNPHGTASGMDYAELCVTYDNRTDELRLLGNGVVPATAERAWNTLIQELCT